MDRRNQIMIKREQNKYSSHESISELDCLCLEKMINIQGSWIRSGFILIDRTSSHEVSVICDIMTLLSLMMTLHMTLSLEMMWAEL